MNKMAIRPALCAAAMLAAFATQAAQPQAPAAAATPAPAAAAAAPATTATPPATAPHVYGHIERALVRTQPQIEIQAQLDGGGDITVLQALDIKYASGEGGVFVHFTIDNGRISSGKTVNQTLPVLRDQLVRDRNGGVEHRPIVSMDFCIGDHGFTTNVSLTPRNNYNPPLLLSKADAAQFGAVDPLKKNTGDPNCAAPQPAPAPTPAPAH